jgi:hypothetical protein
MALLFHARWLQGLLPVLWQMHREWSNIELYRKIQEAGHLYPYFDYAHGYGIPQASYFTSPDKKNTAPTFYFEEGRNQLKVILNEKFIRSSPVQCSETCTII